MKKFYSLFLGLLIALIFSCQKEKEYQTPEKYNDAIIALQEQVYNAVDTLENTMNEDKLDHKAIVAALNNAVNTTDNAIKKLNKLKSYDNDKSLKYAAAELFMTIKKLLNTDFKDLTDKLNKPLKQWTEAEFDSYYDTWDKIDDQINKSEKKLFDAQNKFAEKYQLDLVKEKK
jgi:ElaB/YqjD/DUF883 family membrane-anchored ribosome-binding protein